MAAQRPPLHIFQVELTSYCDMACPYCPHSAMTRPKGHMSADILDRCIARVRDCRRTGIVLHHFGEPLLHPQLGERLRQVKEAGLDVIFSTNGTQLEKKLPLLVAADVRMEITLSVHQWRTGPVEAYWQALASFQSLAQGTRVTIKRAYNVNQQKFFFCRWVNGRVREWDYNTQCFFLRENFGVVLWNGDIASCCVDCHGESVFTNITAPDAVEKTTRSWRGCPSCDLGGRSGEALL